MPVSVTADEIAAKTFLVTMRGYNRAEVDAYMNLIAEEHRRLEGRVAELEDQLQAEEGPPVPDPERSELAEMFSTALAEVRAVRGRLEGLV